MAFALRRFQASWLKLIPLAGCFKLWDSENKVKRTFLQIGGRVLEGRYFNCLWKAVMMPLLSFMSFSSNSCHSAAMDVLVLKHHNIALSSITAVANIVV